LSTKIKEYWLYAKTHWSGDDLLDDPRKAHNRAYAKAMSSGASRSIGGGECPDYTFTPLPAHAHSPLYIYYHN